MDETSQGVTGHGMCVWFTGLSGSGKSTTARHVVELLSRAGREAVLLDGDEIRASLSADLGFSKADRDAHVMRVAALALQVVERHAVAVCALVSPYAATRARVRALIGSERFLEVFVHAPLSVCEARDPKGLYAKARRGEITGFTGIDDPYEAPREPDLVVASADRAVEYNAEQVVRAVAGRVRITPRSGV
jgi:sulfate adenylyltransferase